MKLKNGKQTLVFQAKYASPYDMYQPGEVAGFEPEEAAVLLSGKQPNGQPGVVDYVPTPEVLAQLVKDGLADAPAKK